MSFLTLFWHLANFIAAPLAVAALLVLLAKGLVWRQPLRALTWKRLWLEASLAALAGQIAALALWGVEGKLAGYGLMLVLMVLPLGWRLARRG